MKNHTICKIFCSQNLFILRKRCNFAPKQYINMLYISQIINMNRAGYADADTKHL